MPFEDRYFALSLDSLALNNTRIEGFDNAVLTTADSILHIRILRGIYLYSA